MGKKNSFYSFSEEDVFEDTNGLSSLDAFGKPPADDVENESTPVKLRNKKSR